MKGLSLEEIDREIKYYEKLINDLKIVIIGYEKCLETLKKRRKQNGIN